MAYNTIVYGSNIAAEESVYESVYESQTVSALNQEQEIAEKRIGDSYYGWTMSVFEDTNIIERSFGGTNTVIEDNNKAYKIALSIVPRTDEAIYTLSSNNNSRYSGNISNGVGYSNGYGFNWTKMTMDNKAIIKRSYVGDKWIYNLQMDVQSKDDYYENRGKYSYILNSFTPEFKSESEVRDLSTVNKNGYRTYINAEMSWQIDVLPEWELKLDESFPQRIAFRNIDSKDSISGEISITMSSRGNIANLDSWVSDEVIVTSREYNSDMVQPLKVEKKVINGVDSAVFEKSINTGNLLTYVKTFYLLSDDYKYRLRFMLPAEQYENEDYRSAVEKMVYSFRILSPDISEIGYLADPDELYNDKFYKIVSNDEAGWSLAVPYSWTVSTDRESNKTFISEQSGIIHVGMGVAENVYLEQFTNYYENLVIPISELSGNFKNEKIETLRQKGTTVKKYTNTVKKDNDIYKEEQYVFYKNGYLYTFSVLINQIRNTPKNNEVLDKIWKSVTINH